MTVLLTNDDGINSDGLKMLSKLVISLGFKKSDILTVAPKRDRSATSHAVTLRQPMLLEEISEREFALDGTPADCVVVAIRKILHAKPDFVFSGVNIGANVGSDKIYSGTVAGAMEGFFFDVPSFSISQLYYGTKENIRWNTDSELLISTIKKLITSNAVKNSTISINLPCNKINGVKYIKQGNHKMGNIVDHYDQSDADQNNKDYVIINASNKSIDCEVLNAGYITVTPLGYDLTEYSVLAELNENI